MLLLGIYFRMNPERRRTVYTHNEGRLKVFLCQTLLACLEE